MKRAVLALTIISALLFSEAAGILPVNLARANPSPELDFPLEPIATPPTIVVYSPVQNENCNSTDVLLNFTVIKPESWIQHSGFWGATDETGNKAYDILGNITSVYYVVDGERVNISVLDAPYFFDFHPKPLTLNFSIHLALTKGLHTIQIGFEAQRYYLNKTDEWNGYISSVEVNGTSEVISLSVLQEPFSTALVVAISGVSLTAVSVVLLVYFKKRKR